MSDPTPLHATAARPAFGAVFAPHMAVADYRDGQWGAAEIRPLGPIEIHPAAHVLHYASTCFEGFKAYRWADTSLNVFRMDRNIARMQQSARLLMLPVPDSDQFAGMILDLVDRCGDDIPEAPGSLYLRPVLFGTTPTIGAASVPPAEARLIVLAGPVWDYFEGGLRPLRIFVDNQHLRTAPHLGEAKAGANYASALGPTVAGIRSHGCDQVLFSLDSGIQETGASNFLLIRNGQILTRSLDSTFLPGVTRDSVLTMARGLGFEVIERVFDVDEMLAWIQGGEAALCGTAVVMAGVGTLVYKGREYPVGDGEVGTETRRLRAALMDVQHGVLPDRYGWMTRVEPGVAHAAK